MDLGRGEERGVPSWLLTTKTAEGPSKERYAAMLRIIATDQVEQDVLKVDLDALVREGARRMLLTALKAEVEGAP